MNQSVENAVDKKELRSFGLMMGGMLILIFGLLLPWLWSAEFPKWPWIAAAPFWLLGLLLPMALAPVFRIWLRIGHALGWVNTRIILGFVFFAIIFPIGIILRLLGKDFMAQRLDSDAQSYRVQSKSTSPHKMENPF